MAAKKERGGMEEEENEEKTSENGGLRYTRREHAWSCLKAPLLLSKQVERANNYSTVFILFFYSYHITRVSSVKQEKCG